MDKSQKRPARSLGTKEKASSLSVIVQQATNSLSPGSVEPIPGYATRGGGFSDNYYKIASLHSQ
jgi:hypothetical protein